MGDVAAIAICAEWSRPIFQSLHAYSPRPLFSYSRVRENEGDHVRQVVYWYIFLCDWRCFYLWGLFYSGDGLPQPKLARLRVYVAIEFSSFCHTRLLTANGCGVSSHHPFRSSCPHFSSLSIRSFLVNVFQSNSKRITTPAPQVPVLRRPRALRVLCMVSGTRRAF